jgi:pimeloyl-ACP methyl ester carboxylesterase
MTNDGPIRCSFRGLETVEHEFQLPLDYEAPTGASITVFAREVAAPGGDDRPYLLFFEGGPGYESPRPLGWESLEWISAAVERYRVLLLDQRGTGRSSPLDVAALTTRTPSEQADYLTNFRADSIVRDAERIRRALGIERWTVLGDSFGGLCILHYLSTAPEGLEAALITGGLPPLGSSIDDVYRATYRRVREKVAAYFRRYPADRARVEEIDAWLGSEDVRLPAGDRLSPRRFWQLGWLLGMGDGLERLHYLLELPRGSQAFLIDMERALSYDRQPLYSVLHEACWMDGGASRWSAERTFDPDDSTPFTGEHIFPWMFEEYGTLRPLKEAADLLAEREWGRLYDEEQLRRNEVPVAAAIYAEDMYVEAAFSLETAALVRGLRKWLTDEFEHDGLELGGVRVFRRLLDLIDGRE